MHILTVDQGSPEWLAARRGIPTASEFYRLMTCLSKPGILPKGATTYRDELIAEVLTGESRQFYSKATDHGSKYEEKARADYEFITEYSVTSVGLCVSSNRCWASSPDGFVLDNGIIEIKCPFNPVNHIATVLNGMPEHHRAQVQGGMMVTGRKWCDFISYVSGLDLYIERIYRDDKYIEILNNRLILFTDRLRELLWSKFNTDWPTIKRVEHEH